MNAEVWEKSSRGRMMRNCSLFLIFLAMFPSASVKARTSRASTAASYIERGNDWLAKGEQDWAIADYALPL
jgi:hypothetical protein